MVFLSHRVHLYPFRTQKLSCAEPKILVWRRTGKIGQCQHPFKLKSLFELAHKGVNRIKEKVGVFIAQGPPVPIPNTEVKLCGAEDTCLATDRENKSMPTFFFYTTENTRITKIPDPVSHFAYSVYIFFDNISLYIFLLSLLAGGPRKTIEYCFSTGVN